ncbi:unnamed protein product (macronuclear) [Paramecium tetraurelia]|uniref:Uncharacterized protein n=1 Tax=Paramecium tetraurelia TaxID=5888 RepID=A0BTV4_PARTE|nr:uncharacterized protein GSPATT00032203001 [Paramecium tetraurelia]CAK61971.1 unnamed protein product [Paramecium tetraurelia]|eukprot:XP_001429369.1 hypothetical protein (macronuclear) [Paramecium tetraurelia strain d4-2]
MNDNHILEFQNFPKSIQSKIHQDYFYGRKSLYYHDKTFYRYMSQKQSSDQYEKFDQKEFNFICYAPNNYLQIDASQIRLKFSLRNKESYNLIGSLQNLKYLNEENEEKKLKVCDQTNKFLCPFHFEIKLPQAMDDWQLENFQKQFRNYYCGVKLSSGITQQNKDYICVKDISEPNYQSYLLLKQDVKIGDIKCFALKDHNYPRYFVVRDNKNRYFFDNKNGEQELTFVVGVEEQQIINQYLFSYFILDEQDKDQIEEYKNIKKILKAYQNELQELTNTLRVKVSSFDFDLIVHSNTLNQYALKQGSESNYEGIFDNMDDQIQIYETILQQLSFENGEWRLKIDPNENLMFWQEVEHYQYFYLKKGESALIRCPKANIDFSYIDTIQKDSNQQNNTAKQVNQE